MPMPTQVFSDLLASRARLDPSGMLNLVEQFPRQCQDAWERSGQWDLPHIDAAHIVVLGMGGSAIGGDLLRAYLESQLSVPFQVVRGYEIPAYVGPDTLVIAVSYSGNTEETLSAYQAARARGARLLGFTTGGKLHTICQQDGTPCYPLPPALPPRASLPYGLFSLLRVMESIGLWHEPADSLQELFATLHRCMGLWGPSAADSLPFALAEQLRTSIPVVYGGGAGLDTVAYRWKCQINENAKMIAAWGAFPEMNHNDSAGWSSPHSGQDYSRLQVVLLEDEQVHAQVRKRVRVTEQYLRERVAVHKVAAVGERPLERLLSLVLFGDLMSVYLAYLRNVDPTPVEAIEWLKVRLAEP